MIKVGVTGLRDLTGFDVAGLKKRVRLALKALGDGHDVRIMMNSIAAGADQLCAKIGLSLGFELVCPLPFPDYGDDFAGEEKKRYDRILSKASRSFAVSDGADKEADYLAAGEYIVRNCDVLLAVWDGRPQESICGTAAVVAYAKKIGKEVRTIY